MYAISTYRRIYLLYGGLHTVIRHADPLFPDPNMTGVSQFDGWKS